MKKNLLALILIVGIILSIAAGAFADNIVKSITAQINYNLKMSLNNQIFEPTESDGSAVRPITYNGRTYLPVRALCEALGIAVDYDVSTETVLLGEKEWTPLTVNMFKSPHDGEYVPQFTTDSDLLYVSGKTYNYGLVVRKTGNQYGTSTINTDGKYQKMKFSVAGSIDNDITLIFTNSDTGQLLKSVEVTTFEKVVEIDLNGAKKVEISNRYKGRGNKIVIGDVLLK